MNNPMVPTSSSGGGGGGGSGNAITADFIADTDLAAGTAVSLNSSGHAVQTWGPAPNVAGVVTTASNAAIAALINPSTGVNYASVTSLGASNYVAWVNISGNSGAVATPLSRSGSTLTVGTTNIADFSTGIGLLLPMSSTAFVAAEYSVSGVIGGSISGGVISVGSEVSLGAVVNAGVSLSASIFVLALANGTMVAGSDVANAITFGTPVSDGMSNSPCTMARLSATSFAIVFADQSAAGVVTAIVGTVSGTAITLGSPVALTSFDVGGNNWMSRLLAPSGSLIVAGWQGTDLAFHAAAASVSGTTPTWGTPVVVSYSPLPAQASLDGLAFGGPVSQGMTATVIDATHVAFGAGSVLPQPYTISGTTLSGSAAIPLENVGAPGIQQFNNLTSLAINSIVSVFQGLMVANAISQVYEVGSGGLQSPPIDHNDLFNYGLNPGDSTHVLAWFFDTNFNFKARVIVSQAINASGPVGCAASAVTSGDTATVTLSGACSGFSGLTPGALYFANGDGTVTTGNIGHPIGVAATASQLIVQ